MASKYEARDARAKAEGWSGYGQKRAAQALGYTTPRLYTDAKRGAQSKRAPVPALPGVTRRTRGVAVRSFPGGRVGLAGPGAGVWREMSRYGVSRRVEIYVGGRKVGRRGFSLQYLRDLYDAGDYDTFDDFLADLIELSAGTDSESGQGNQSVTPTVSVMLS